MPSRLLIAKKNDKPLTPRQSERRDRIMNATQAMLARHGYDGVSMRQIAKEAGVAERTLFNIYTTKDALIASSARARSSGIIAEAWNKAPDPGPGFFETLCGILAHYTLIDPPMARAFAPVLIRHSDLVGLHELYCDFVGRSLASLCEKDELSQEAVDALPALIAMNVVSTVVQWAADLIADEKLESHLRLLMAQAILPHARGSLQQWAGDMARDAVERIAAA